MLKHSQAKSTARKMTIVNIIILGGGLLVVFTIMPRPVIDKVKLEAYQCDHGRYTVLFPPEPVACSRLEETEHGILPFICIQKDSSHFFYRVGYTDYPVGVFEHLTADRVFEENVERLADKSNGRIIAEKTENVTVGGFEGKQYDVLAPNMSFRVRLILAGNRLYQVLVSSSDKELKDERIDQILHSFYIHK